MILLINDLTSQLLVLIAIFGIILILLEVTKPPRVVSREVYYNPPTALSTESSSPSPEAAFYLAHVRGLHHKVEMLHARMVALEHKMDRLSPPVAGEATLLTSSSSESSERGVPPYA